VMAKRTALMAVGLDPVLVEINRTLLALAL
jgi:hypothetical protein